MENGCSDETVVLGVWWLDWEGFGDGVLKDCGNAVGDGSLFRAGVDGTGGVDEKNERIEDCCFFDERASLDPFMCDMGGREARWRWDADHAESVVTSLRLQET